MQLSHSFTVSASVEDTWATFMDLHLVGGCFPGATVTDVDADDFAGTVKVKLGPIAMVYAGTGTFVERDASAHRAVIEAKGKDKRGNGTAGATVTIQLSAEEAGSTRADVSTYLSITGKPAQFGRGVMQDVSDKLLQQFVGCVEGKLTPQGAAPAQAPTPAQGAAPAQATTPAQAPAQATTPARADASAGSLDVGAAVLPSLLRAYRGHLAAALAGLAVVVLLGVRLRSRRR